MRWKDITCDRGGAYLEPCQTSMVELFEKIVAVFYSIATQSVFTCSKLTIETLEQGVKYVQS